jgi:hypothetical protein
MNKLLYIILLILALPFNGKAQEIRRGPLHSFDSPREDWLLPGDTLVDKNGSRVYTGESVQLKEQSKKENNAVTNTFADMHEGLNASIDLSAFYVSGKGLPHHGGFSQGVDLTYLAPLTKDKKAWFALGGDVRHINWGSDRYYNASLYAMLGYKFNEYWEAWIYGQKNIANNFNNYGWGYGRYGMWGWTPLYGPMYYNRVGMGTPGADVLGAAVRYSPNKNFFIQINVEGAWYNNNSPAYFDQYNYPGNTGMRVK